MGHVGYAIYVFGMYQLIDWHQHEQKTTNSLSRLSYQWNMQGLRTPRYISDSCEDPIRPNTADCKTGVLLLTHKVY